jgi:Bucentaur or craniofacial development
MPNDTVLQTNNNNSNLTPLQLQRVDDAFEELFGYKWGTLFELNSSESESMTPAARVLCEILGPTAAARILQSRSSHATTETKSHTTVSLGGIASSVSTKPVAHKKQQHYKASSIAASSVGGTQSSERVTSKGPPLTTTTVSGLAEKATTAAATATIKQAPACSGVDSLLNQLNGPNKTSTIAKTAADWDQFKEVTGLGEKLEEQADSSTAYLKKQDFLTRVDHRTFELERKERDRNRAKRG